MHLSVPFPETTARQATHFLEIISYNYSSILSLFNLGSEIRLVFNKYSLVALILSLVVAYSGGDRTGIAHTFKF